jgi:hypothetical protein
MHLLLHLVNYSSNLIILCTSDECYLVLNRTPLFIFVKPLAVLLPNILVCFSVFWCCRSLRWNLGRKGENGQKKRSMLPATTLKPSLHDQAQAQSSRISRTCPSRPYVPLLSPCAVEDPKSSYLRSRAASTIERIHDYARAHHLRLSAALRPSSISFCINRTLSVNFVGWCFWECSWEHKPSVWVCPCPL